MNSTAAKVFASSSSSLLRQRLLKASTFALYDEASQKLASSTITPLSNLDGATTRWRQTTIRPMSSVVVTQTNAGEVVSSSPSSLPTSSPPSSVSSEEPLIVTPACFQRIQHLLQQRNKSPNSMYLRVFVDAGGCSGFQYQFDLIEDANEAVDPEQDVVLKSDSGSRLVVDQTSLQYMKGATVDYVQQMIKSAFSVTYNPQSESACGCGSSFAVKNFSSNPALD